MRHKHGREATPIYGCFLVRACADDVISAVQVDGPELVHHRSLINHQHRAGRRKMSLFWLWLPMILLSTLTNINTVLTTCTGYTNLSDPWRNVGFCYNSCHESDINLTQGWYRFTGIGGDELISSCAHALNNTSGNETVYNLFTCNSDMNDTMYMTCSEGFTVYELRPTQKYYTTRHSFCSNSSSCGKDAQCGTVYGSCECQPGFKPKYPMHSDSFGCTVLTVSDDCKSTSCAGGFLNELDQLLNSTDEPLPQKTVELYLGTVMSVTNSIAANSNDSKALISYGNNVLAVTEKLMSSVVTPTKTQNTTTIKSDSLVAQVFMVGSETTLNEIPSLNASNSSMNVDLIGISKKNNGSASVVFMSYFNMYNILKATFFNTATDATKTIISSVVSGTLPKVTKKELTSPVNFTLNYINGIKPSGNLTCVYWKESEWVEDGCSITEQNDTYTVCSCTHLSTFALIMLTDPTKVDDDPFLEVMNAVAVSVGLVFLVLTILTLAVCQRGPKLTNAALLNLCISLFLAHLIFLLTDKYLNNIPSQLCAMRAGIIHFLFLSAFVWMFIEAVLLYIFVKNLSKFTSKQREILNWKCMIVIGYVIPLAVVGVTAGLYPDGYGGEKCWLKPEFIWSFLGPVSCILAINFLLSVVIIINLRQALKKLDKTVSHLQHTRVLVFKTLLQFIILGVPWALGFFADSSQMILIIFLFINSQQGTVIFLVHCAFNQEIRRQYRKWWNDLCHHAKYNSMAEDQTKSSHSN
ncbi:adhesion G protein-coupled receptor E3-like [Neoarius graeffei]|uniref:adhesion G protein-coupled receptor E3-like n=1 Tax=Neoarius graeffei TaxID=443677 RepID=UPI00298D09B9|nr:adhesion G protein-coupled receptor E3-like [Neoarius graeffei]